MACQTNRMPKTRAVAGVAIPVALLALVVTAVPDGARAAVQRVEVYSREDVLGGTPFGSAGAYEKLGGKIAFVFDPTNPANARIVDLAKAPRNAGGMVEAWANFTVLRPKDPRKGRGVALLEVSNRGRKALLAYFQRASWSLDPSVAEHFGDGLLMQQGLTLIWVGWQFDVQSRDGLLRLHVPIATDDGKPIEGLVRSDWTVDRTVRTLSLGHRNHVSYPVHDPGRPDNVLTVRDGRLAPRRVVPRDQWRFAREAGGEVVEDRGHIHMPAGFLAGKIYELVYRGRNPVVAGLGLAAVRDVVSYAKYDSRSLFPAKAGIAVGISQTGRFLRQFIYEGFNTDEQGRKAFDGMLIHTAGAGRGSFNHRFAQPSRDAQRYSSFFYPVDLFPFTGRAQRDPETGRSDGLFARQSQDHLPKVFYTNTGYEYWGRAASLIHTTVDGRADTELLSNERVYHLAGGQHFVGSFPPASRAAGEGVRAYRGNPLDFLVSLRALLVRLTAWVADGVEPPRSSHPRIDAGSLVSIDRVRFLTLSTTWPTSWGWMSLTGSSLLRSISLPESPSLR